MQNNEKEGAVVELGADLESAEGRNKFIQQEAERQIKSLFEFRVKEGAKMDSYEAKAEIAESILEVIIELAKSEIDAIKEVWDSEGTEEDPDQRAAQIKNQIYRMAKGLHQAATRPELAGRRDEEVYSADQVQQELKGALIGRVIDSSADFSGALGRYAVVDKFLSGGGKIEEGWTYQDLVNSAYESEDEKEAGLDAWNEIGGAVNKLQGLAAIVNGKQMRAREGDDVRFMADLGLIDRDGVLYTQEQIEERNQGNDVFAEQMKDVAKVKERVESLENAYQDAENIKREKQKEYRKLESDRTEALEQLLALRARQRELEGRLQRATENEQSRESELEEKQRELEEIQAKVKKGDTFMGRLLRGGVLEAQKEEVGIIEKEIQALDRKVQSARRERKRIEAEIKNVEENIENTTQEVKKIEEKLAA